MTKTFNIDGLDCLCCVCQDTADLAYVLYPMNVLDNWIEAASKKYRTSIVVITGMDWDNAFSPWPAPGEPPGDPDFQGKSKEFLARLNDTVIPGIEKQLGMDNPCRTLVGVSISGLFALWQWMLCDTFANIASLSGSFWYPGFIEWIRKIEIPRKSGKGYFLLGVQEPKSNVKAFDSVGINTQEIISLLKGAGINAQFENVPGNHFSDPIPRLDRAFAGIFTLSNKTK